MSLAGQLPCCSYDIVTKSNLSSVGGIHARKLLVRAIYTSCAHGKHHCDKSFDHNPACRKKSGEGGVPALLCARRRVACTIGSIQCQSSTNRAKGQLHSVEQVLGC